MRRRAEFSAEATTFVTVSAIVHDECDDGYERLLVIEMAHGSKIVFRGDDIAAFHDAVHECENVMGNLEMTLRAARATNAEQPDPEPAETESISDSALGMLRMMGKGSLVHDNVEGGRCRYATAVATLPEEHLEELRSRRLVQIVEQDELNSRCTWGISVEGRAYLAKQEG